MTDQELFDRLKREGECWHKWDKHFNRNCYSPLYYVCALCKKKVLSWEQTELYPNPNFSTWEGFGWLWERAQEKEWWGRFWQDRIASFKRDNEEGFSRPWPDPFLDHNINPTRFTQALKDFLKEGENG